MRNHSFLNACYEALDMTVFASPDQLPVLNRRYEAAFTVYAAAVRIQAAAPITCCALCDEASNDLAPLKSDDVYTLAVRQYSLEREDVLCPDCRTAFDADYEDSRSFKHWSYLGR